MHNLQALEWAVTVPFVVATLASFALRLYSRVILIKQFGADDVAISIGFFVWIGQQFIAWKWLTLGAGKHMDEVSNANYMEIRTYLFVEEFWYLLLQFCIKISFLMFYRRLFSTFRRFLVVIYCVVGIVCIQTVGTWFFYGFQCRPLDAFFHPELYAADACLSTNVAYYLPSAVNVSVDVIIYLLPIYPVWSIQTSLRRRLGLIGIFTLGGGAVLVSLLRFIVLHQLAVEPDFTYIFGRVVIVTTIEFCAAIITCNTPAMSAVWNAHVRNKNASSDPSVPDYSHELSSGPNYFGGRNKKQRHSTITDVIAGEENGKGVEGSRTGSEEELFRVGKYGEINVTSSVDVISRPKKDGFDSTYYKFPSPNVKMEAVDERRGG